MNAAIIVLAPERAADQTRNIVGALAESDLDVFWPQAVNGETETHLLNRLENCRCAIIVWGQGATADTATSFRSLASLAAQTNRAILVRLDNTPIAAELAKLTVYDLRGWRARQSSLFMLDLVAAAKSKAAGLDPPLQRAPRQLLFRRLAVAIPSVIGAVAVIIGLYRDAGLDRIAGPEERAAWTARAEGSCDDLSKFLRQFPNGAYASEANSLLQARKTSQQIVYRRKEREMEIYVPLHDAIPQTTKTSAEAAALARADTEAGKQCSRLARSTEAALKSSKVISPAISCKAATGGFVCKVNAVALCALDEPEPDMVESCHGG